MTFGYSAKVPLALSVVRNLIAWLESELTMNRHVNNLCGATYFHLYNLRRVEKELLKETCEQLVHAFITSRMDCCNSLLYGLSAEQLDKFSVYMKHCGA